MTGIIICLFGVLFLAFSPLSKQPSISNRNNCFPSMKNVIEEKEQQVEYTYDYFINNQIWRKTSFDGIISNYLSIINNPSDERHNLCQQILNETYLASFDEWLIANKQSIYLNTKSFQDDLETNFSIALAALTWFNINGYDLSSELFTHFLYNSNTYVPGNYYEPINGNRIMHSSISRDIALNSNVSGSNTFLQSTTSYATYLGESATISHDLYYSIKAFDFTKANSNSRTFILTDTYDFNSTNDAPFLETVAINAALWLQNNGVCNIFDIKYVCTPPIAVESITYYTNVSEYSSYISFGDPYSIVVQKSSSLSLLLLTLGSGISTFEVYSWDVSNTFISSYAGGGIGTNSCFSMGASYDGYYYIKIKTTANEPNLNKILIIQTNQTSLPSSSNIISNTGTYSGVLGDRDVRIFVVSFPNSGNHSFYISNGYEEYCFEMELINPILCISYCANVEYEPTYSEMTEYVSSAFTYLLLVYYEDFTDGGQSFNLIVG